MPSRRNRMRRKRRTRRLRLERALHMDETVSDTSDEFLKRASSHTTWAGSCFEACLFSMNLRVIQLEIHSSESFSMMSGSGTSMAAPHGLNIYCAVVVPKSRHTGSHRATSRSLTGINGRRETTPFMGLARLCRVVILLLNLPVESTCSLALFIQEKKHKQKDVDVNGWSQLLTSLLSRWFSSKSTKKTLCPMCMILLLLQRCYLEEAPH